MQIIVNKLITNYLHSNFIIIQQDALMVVSRYTGLAYIDVKNLRQEHIVELDGKLWINTKRQKTGNPVNVLLLDIPKMIIEKYRTVPSNGVFPVLSNQITT